MRVSSDLAKLCDADRLFAAPDGRLILGLDSGMSATLAVVDCLDGEKPCRVWSLSPRSGIVDWRWRGSDSLDLKLFDGSVQRFSTATGEVSTALQSDLHEAVEPGARIDLGHAVDGRLEPVLGSAETFTVVSARSTENGTDYVLLDRSSHRVSALIDGALSKTDLSVRWSPTLTLATDQDGDPVILGPGVRHRIDDGIGRERDGGIYQARPIIDASTGLHVGDFGDDRLIDLNAPPITRMDVGAIAEVDHIADVAHASAGDLWLARVRTLAGHDRLIWHGDQTSRIDCPPPRRRQTQAPIDAAVMVENWGSAERPVMVRRRLQSVPTRGTVVIWPGGPGRTFAAGGAGGFEPSWLARGFDTVIVDGSGSQGEALGRRLRDGGFAAVLADARAVADRLASPEFDARPIVVNGGSFGGAAAAETARRVSEARPDRTGPRLLLIAPWLRYRAPAQVPDASARERVNLDFAARSETAAFGDTSRYAADMEAWRSDFAFHGETLAIFAETDTVSSPSDLWSAPESVLEVVVSPGVDHRFVASSPATRSAIERWLADL